MLEELQCLECRLDDSSKIIGKADREKLLENRGGLGREREEELVSIVFNILFRLPVPGALYDWSIDFDSLRQHLR